jgi:hypothetical protein
LDDTPSVFQTGIAVEMRRFRILRLDRDPEQDRILVAWSRDRKACFICISCGTFIIGALMEGDSIRFNCGSVSVAIGSCADMMRSDASLKAVVV